MLDQAVSPDGHLGGAGGEGVIGIIVIEQSGSSHG